LLAEGFLLSAVGSALGVAFAWAAVRLFDAANPIELSPGAELTVNLPVLGFGAGLSIVTAILFSIVPAIRASRVDLAAAMKKGRRAGLANAVVALEVALSFVLLTAAGLFLSTAMRMESESLGFDPDGMIATRITLPSVRYRVDADRSLPSRRRTQPNCRR
jgi:putative ABC transport system permease protein